jgi:hypothetical protein
MIPSNAECSLLNLAQDAQGWRQQLGLDWLPPSASAASCSLPCSLAWIAEGTGDTYVTSC